MKNKNQMSNFYLFFDRKFPEYSEFNGIFLEVLKLDNEVFSFITRIEIPLTKWINK